MYESLLILTILINISADFLDRYAANKSDPYVLTLWTSIVQFLLIFPTIGLVGYLSLPHFFFVALVSVFAAYGRVRWFRALSEGREQLSRLAPLTRVSSVIVLVLAVALLGESLSLTQGVGAGLIILGAFLVSSERWSSRWREFLSSNRALGLVLIYAASTACLSVLYKYLLMSQVSMWTIYFYVRLFQVLPLVLYGVHHDVLTTSYLKIRNLKLFVFGRVLQTAAAFLYLLVVKNLDLTTVEPIAALGPLVLLFAEWALTKFREINPGHKAVAEPPTRMDFRVTLLRVVAVAVTILGVFILSKR